MYDELRNHLERLKKDLKGDWIRKNSSYDIWICTTLGMTPKKCRYWDAEWNGLLLEFKKGSSIWLDLVRYSEILLRVTAEASVETLTVFFVPTSSKDRIEEIIVTDTKALIQKLALTDDIARRLVQLNEHVPRQLNAQASLTLSDVRKVSMWVL